MYLEKATLLCVDDEALVRQSLSAFLEDYGVKVLEADSVDTAHACLANHKVDIVLTDLQMPGENGLSLIERINMLYPDLPVLVISGAGRMEDAITALKLGAWDYLIKPIEDFSVLAHTLEHVLERAALRRDNQQYKIELEAKNQDLEKNLSQLQEDQEAGRSIQLRLLPPAESKVEHLSISYRIHPSLVLSGDAIDYFVQGEHLFFYIADVSGHGAASAFVTVWLKHCFYRMTVPHVSAPIDLLSPNQTLSYLSKELYNAHLGKYITMIYGVLHLPTHTLKYSVAGHYPNLIVLENEQASYLPGQGFPVGIMQQTSFLEHELQLPKNFKLLLSSDGVLELLKAPNLVEKEKEWLQAVEQTQCSLEGLQACLGLQNSKVLSDDCSLLAITSH